MSIQKKIIKWKKKKQVDTGAENTPQMAVDFE